MRVLVTGGAGFIGSHLIDYLLKETDADITALDDFSTGDRSNLAHIDSNRLQIVEGDVREESTVEKEMKKADEVYHLAAAVGVKKIVEKPLESLRINLTGTENVLDAAVDGNTPVYIASSSEVYGRSEDIPFSEDDNRILGPPSTMRWSYATAKAADEYMGLGYHKTYELPVVIGRLFNTVGPRQTGQYGMVIPTFVKQAMKDEPLTVYGDGSQTRCFGHVEEVVEAIHTLVQTPQAHGEVFNIGATEPITINELAERVIKLSESSSTITHIPFEEVYGDEYEEPEHRVPNVSKLRETIGWAPDADIDTILEDIIANHKRNPIGADN